ncbi:adenylyl-sulfate kinase [Desulfovibrio ferrophilus]|uniref:Adenylylsulfate kinase n=1 Tax=Desulfovibrio ferrophilus TaxID=241368 RepID=A0A2Z6AYT2_9BACT|nr:adenylyl-sulfate kinase [Desulfovibrio ferrophilus]BBD08343.1 adenylylsulfate kinase [Desulfovibrio ferrophilus]
MAESARQGWAIWVVGLPGSGKSNLARAVAEEFGAQGKAVTWLQMDARRKAYFPKPTYSKEEREEAYRLFAEEAAELTRSGINVVMDGAAYKAAFREYARRLIPRFAEVHVQCTLENAMAREGKRAAGLVMAGLYAKALERKRSGKQFPGLGEVIGVDVPFEENPAAEFAICNDNIPKQETRRRTLEFLHRWLSEEAAPDGQ